MAGLDESLGLQETGAPKFFTQSAHEGGKTVSPTHRPPLPPYEVILVLISLRG
jgi:hypothetical protein